MLNSVPYGSCMCCARTRNLAVILSCAIAMSLGRGAVADPCVAPDDTSGTVSLPPEGCDYLSPDEVHVITNGLPPGTTIELAPIHIDFICRKTNPGNPNHCGVDDGTGTRGEIEVFDSVLELNMQGTGALSSFQRNITMNLFCQTHTDPRNPGDAVQDFDTEMVQLQGTLPPGDPDFQSLTITAGSANGLPPSPGHTTLTRLGPTGSDWVVDSFFDIAYRIDFEGAPGGQLEGLSGTTDASVRMEARDDSCAPKPDGLGCFEVTSCGLADESCNVKCVNYDASTGESRVIDCGCTGQDDCHVDFTPPSGPTRGATGNDCVVAEGPPGTVSLPPAGCAYLSPDEVHEIVNGLPAGTTIELDASHEEFTVQQPPQPGGSLGGEIEQFSSILILNAQGLTNGAPNGFNRTLFVPVNCEVHTGPRNPGDPVQTFPNDMFRLQGELFGDPDFCTLRITGGTDFGLPSPGQTTLTQLPSGDFRVDSFFDIAYEIEFEGCPGSVLEGASGTTASSVRMQTGLAPSCAGQCPAGTDCVETVVQQPDGSIDFCCDCTGPAECGPTPDGTACLPAECPDPTTEQCLATCANFDPATGLAQLLDCACRDSQTCHIEVADDPTGAGSGFRGAPGNPCVIPEDPPASGTVTLPPAGCDYLSPDEVHMIIDGLPADTEIELAPIHRDFICKTQPGASFPDCPPPGVCEQADPNGLGNVDCFSSQLQLDVRGNDGGALDGFQRQLSIQVDCQVVTDPRNPGDPVQEFDTEFRFLQGELVGDPDFCMLRFTGGNGFGLPSPGHTTLTRLPSGDFTVDSFFDIAYQIEFEGCPGSQLDGFSGTTQGTIRMTTGAQPRCVGTCPPNTTCVDTQTVLADGTIDICCECVPTLPPCADTDVDCSGATTAGDIIVVRNPANFNQAACDASNPRADVDRSGTVTAGDVIVIRNPANFNTSTGPCECTPHPDCP